MTSIGGGYDTLCNSIDILIDDSIDISKFTGIDIDQGHGIFFLLFFLWGVCFLWCLH